MDDLELAGSGLASTVAATVRIDAGRSRRICAQQENGMTIEVSARGQTYSDQRDYRETDRI